MALHIEKPPTVQAKKPKKTKRNTPTKSIAVGEETFVEVGPVVFLSQTPPFGTGTETQTEVQTPVQSIAVPVIEALDSETALLNEYLLLHNKYEELEVKELTSRMEAVKKQLQEIANEMHDKTATVVFQSKEGSMTFSPRAENTTFSANQKSSLLQHLAEKYGEEVAMSVISIGVTNLKKVLSENEIEQYSHKEEGSRTLKAVHHK